MKSIPAEPFLHPAVRDAITENFASTADAEGVGMLKAAVAVLAGAIQGAAIEARLAKADYRTFVISSDGESNEGSVWEAAMFAAAQKLPYYYDPDFMTKPDAVKARYEALAKQAFGRLQKATWCLSMHALHRQMAPRP